MIFMVEKGKRGKGAWSKAEMNDYIRRMYMKTISSQRIIADRSWCKPRPVVVSGEGGIIGPSGAIIREKNEASTPQAG